MTTNIKKSKVKGGWVARDMRSGRFVAVGTDTSVHKRSPKTEETVKDVSNRRSAALKRLANR